MNFKDIPPEIGESKLLGEMIGWNILETFIDDLPPSRIKENILDLIDVRRKQIMESEL